MNYLIVSLVVIVGSIITTPSFLTKSKFTFVSETEVSFTPEWEQHSLTTLWDEEHPERKYNITNRYTNENTIACILPIFVFITLLSFIILFFIISGLLLLPLYTQDNGTCDIPHLISSVYHN